jgi:ATP/ADP translocase
LLSAAAAAAGDTQLLSLRVLIGTVMAMTAAMFAAKAFIDAKVLQPALKSVDGAAAAGGAKPAGKKKKSKGSFGEGIAVLKKSPKIRNLALLVMSYGVGHRYVLNVLTQLCLITCHVLSSLKARAR